MKQFIFSLCFILMCGIAFAKECYYVYVDKKNEEVIDIIKCSIINPPKHDFNNFKIIRMKLTLDERSELIGYSKNEDEVINKINIEMNDLEKGDSSVEKEYTKDEIISKITITIISDIVIK